MFYFPQRLKNIQAATDKLQSEGYSKSSVKELWCQLRSLAMNHTYSLLSLAHAGDWFILAGMATFLPKFFELQYQLSIGTSSQIVGALAVTGGATSSTLVGMSMKKYVHTRSGAIKFCILAQLINLPLMFVLLGTCPSLNFIGVNHVKNNEIPSPSVVGSPSIKPQLSSSCFSSFDPVCGSDNLMYLSPCHADCSAIMINGNVPPVKF